MALTTNAKFSGFTWQNRSDSGSAYRDQDAFFQEGADLSDQIDWLAMCEHASSINEGIACTVEEGLGMGGRHIVRAFNFESGERWIIRIRKDSIYVPTAEDCENGYLEWRDGMEDYSKRDAACQQLVKDRSSIPVAAIFDFQARSEKMGGLDFMLMECLPGNMGREVIDIVLPADKKPQYFHELAKVQVQMANITFPKIGTVKRLPDGFYDNGPIPGIGGPFDTAAEYLEAWANTVKFPRLDDEEHLRVYSAGHYDAIIPEIKAFPKRIANLAKSLIIGNDGPFPLVHGDFGLENILVDDDFRVVGVIDWEDAYTAPWENVMFPSDLQRCLDGLLDDPAAYDDNGYPLDEHTRQVFQGQLCYVDAVRLHEKEMDLAPRLSQHLSSHAASGFADMLFRYTSGAPGFYCKTLDLYESMKQKEQPMSQEEQAVSQGEQPDSEEERPVLEKEQSISEKLFDMLCWARFWDTE